MSHLIIVQNGFLGFHFRLLYFVKFIMKSLGSDYKIVISDVNNFIKSLDGIKKGGERLAEFTKRQCIKEKPTSISFIGHSLGGLYVRSCIGSLEKGKFFENITPNLFITIASPHLGASCNKIYKLFSHIAFGTIKELFLNDKKQIIYEMSKENTDYINGLKRFSRRIMYGNLTYDFKVNYQTACMCTRLLYNKPYQKNKLIEIDPQHDCLRCIDNKILNNVLNLNVTRKVIDMGFCWFNNHCEIISAWIGKKTFVAEDIVNYLRNI